MGTADFRSDTVTVPTPEMREAMASAEVGDDVYIEDPTVLRLQERAAELVGQEAALFVPSGSMGNQIAVHLHTRPGDEVLIEERGHTYKYELGAMAALSGAMPRTLKGDRGLLEPESIRRAAGGTAYYISPVSLLILENTHNMAGGTVWPQDRFAAVVDAARDVDLRVHLDGARLFNAAEAAGEPASTWGSRVDSLMFCLSKGLGAPVGSLLCGTEAFITRARRVRKMFGGGMRQVGVLAAAGEVALEAGRARLGEDHRRARRLRDGLDALAWITCPPCETNIVLAELGEGAPDAAAFTEGLAGEGVRAGAVDRRRVRFVTHRDVDDEDVERAVAAAETTLSVAG